MRLFVILRTVFLLVLLAASSLILLHSKLCINYVPHELDGFLKKCQAAVESISQVQMEPIVLTNWTVVTNRTTRSISEGDEVRINETDASEFDVDEMDGLLENITVADKWHRMYLENKDELVTVNVKTCFDFSMNHIVTGSEPKYVDIISPLRLTLILTVTSLLLAILDMSLRVFIKQFSFIQSLAHTFIQLALWGAILVNMEMYRRNWTQNWLKLGQTPTEIPMYPAEWENFEFYAFFMMLLTILDVLLFEHLSKKVKLMKSQGVYKCIDQDAN
ncbi:hypothetical protein B9Z55_017250 [Caenorhabditis nigoni]|uniref:Uncharacterized protein n=1 Tax=Caenorhabditis nigoni TaxID=1611254 RepID=A0A2G5T908_9PELO|nr:hypothetical protein B9Z55_017250 [Caenorhabditis nigoni]